MKTETDRETERQRDRETQRQRGQRDKGNNRKTKRVCAIFEFLQN
jgi:hypothetical protein